MRIMFVLKCQESMRPFTKFSYLRKFNIRFEKYNYDKENSLIKSKDNVFKLIKDACSSKEPIIKLSDPQKRLEDNLSELARNTTEDLKALKEVITNKINDVAIKLSTAQQRLEDNLVENTIHNFNTLEDSENQISELETSLTKGIFNFQIFYFDLKIL
jgi:hypothetical protein